MLLYGHREQHRANGVNNMSKTYTIAGTSTLNGVNTFRFATGKAKARAAVLTRNGHTDVNLMDLPNEMSKEDAMAWLVAQGVQAVLPRGHRNTTNPKKVRAEAAVEAPVGEQQDAHVQTFQDDAARKAAFVQKMREAKARKAAERAAAEQAAAEVAA